MNFLITDYEKIPLDLYEVCPAYKQKQIGRKNIYVLLSIIYLNRV